MENFIGEFAALGTALCWSMNSIFFTQAGRMVGSPIVNRTRLLIALLIIMVVHTVALGSPLPFDAEGWRWGWLALSGVIGFIIGDALLFQAFVMIGPRLSMLLMDLAPVMSTLLGWVILDEILAFGELFGIALAVGGVVWVITDRKGNTTAINPKALDSNPRYYLIGVLFGFGGAVGQATGLIASKLGVEGDFNALSGNTIRLLVSTAGIWLIAALNRDIHTNFVKLREQPKALQGITLGAFFGPFLGVSLSLLAVQHTDVGIASTLMGLTPIILIPIGVIFFKETVGIRAILGTLLAVLGTALIFLS